MRQVAIFGGGDWADASCDLLDVPEGVDIPAEIEKRKKYYNEEYLPELRSGKNPKPKYLTLPEWLKQKCGAVDASTIEQVWDE